jgi:hypothetical protein
LIKAAASAHRRGEIIRIPAKVSAGMIPPAGLDIFSFSRKSKAMMSSHIDPLGRRIK